MIGRVAALLRMKPPLVADVGLLFSSGPTVPSDDTVGYQPSCMFQDTTNGIVYVNEGSVAACDFNAVEAGSITSPPIVLTGDTADALTGGGIQYGTSAAEITYTPVSTGSHSGFQVYITSEDCISGLSIAAVRTKVTLTGTTAATAYGAQFWTKINCTDYTGHYLGGHPVGCAGIIECVGTARTAASVYAVMAGVCGEVRPISGTVDAGGTICGLHAKVFGTSAQVSVGSVVGVLVQAIGGGASDVGILVQPHVSASWTVGLDFDSGYGAITTAIDIGTVTTGVSFTGTVTTGIDFTGVTLTPDPNRTNSAIAIGDRLGAKTITFAAEVDHLDPIQINLLTAGVNPTAGSTVNGIYQLITHATDMSGLRLKCSDWNIAISKDIQDAYVYQGEVVFSGSSVTVGGEAAVLGLVMNAGSSAVTGSLRGLIISMQGAGFPADGIGIELRSTATTLAEGIRISGTPLTTVGIAMGNQANDNEGPVNAFFFPSGPSADEGPVRNTAEAGTGAGSILIKIGSSTKYLQFWDNPS